MAIKVNAKQVGSPGDPCCCGFVGACSTEGRAKAAIPCLCGFAELTDPSDPPRIYKKKTKSGDLTFDVFNNAGCATDETGGSQLNAPDFHWTAPGDIPVVTRGSITWQRDNDWQVTITAQVSNAIGSGAIIVGVSANNSGAQTGAKLADKGTWILDLHDYSNVFPVMVFVAVGRDYYGWAQGATSDAVVLAGLRYRLHRTQDHWDLVSDYGPHLAAKPSNCSFIQTDGSTRYLDGALVIGPTESLYSGLSREVLTANRRVVTGTQECVLTQLSPVNYSKLSGVLTEQLSEEDTEDDALNRANAGLSWSPPAANCVATFAFRTDRATSACFGYRDVQVRAHVSGLTVGRNYEVHFSMYRRALGTMTPRSFLNEVVLHVTATLAVDVTGWVDVPNEGPGWDTICAGCFVKLAI